MAKPEPNKPPDPQKVSLALCQMSVTKNKQVNIATALATIMAAAERGADIVVLPEMWNCPYSNDSFPEYAEDFSAAFRDAPSVSALAQAAKTAEVVLIGGSVPERAGGKLYNTCCVFDTDGSLLAKHRKTHLFDICIPGKIEFKESETLTAGSGLTCVPTRFGRLGLGICYDLRFPEMAMIYRERGADIVVYPGAFNMTTGPVHWQLLQQARALDNQLYVASCSPARDADAGYVAYGHSMIAGPFGEVVASLGAEEDVLVQEIDLGQIRERRAAIPTAAQKRRDLYALVDESPPRAGVA